MIICKQTKTEITSQVSNEQLLSAAFTLDVEANHKFPKMAVECITLSMEILLTAILGW